MQTDEYAKMRAQEDHYWWFVARRQLALELLTNFADRQGPILDVGSGTGAMLSQLTDFGPAYGVDFSPEALRFAQDRGLPRLVQGDAARLPFRDASFQTVVTLDTLEHVQDDRRAISEIARVLQPGGTVVLNVPAFRSLWGPHDEALMHFRRYRKAEVRDLLLGAGLDVRLLSYSVFYLFPAVVAVRLRDRFRRGPAVVRLPGVSERANQRLINLMAAESRTILRRPLPWGSSIVAVAQKPRTTA